MKSAILFVTTWSIIDVPVCTQVGAQYKPGEVAKSEWAAVQQSPPWAVDAWGVGCLMQEAFSAKILSRTEDLRSTEPIPQPLLQVR